MIKAFIALFLLICGSAYAEDTGSVVAGRAVDRSTVNGSVAITTGNTFQELLPSIIGNAAAIRQALTIENNNTTDSCWLIIGTNQITPGSTTLSSNVTIAGKTITAQQAAILLMAGGSYQRYFPYVPSDAIYGTCSSGDGTDSIYLDYN